MNSISVISDKDIENLSFSQYMDQSEFIDDDVYDGRISDVLRS